LAYAARISQPHLKVLFITGFTEHVLVKNEVLEAGTAVITKPFAMNSLSARVRQLIIT
jgi:DNA-binding response OmpR family regulator